MSLEVMVRYDLRKRFLIDLFVYPLFLNCLSSVFPSLYIGVAPGPSTDLRVVLKICAVRVDKIMSIYLPNHDK